MLGDYDDWKLQEEAFMEAARAYSGGQFTLGNEIKKAVRTAKMTGDCRTLKLFLMGIEDS